MSTEIVPVDDPIEEPCRPEKRPVVYREEEEGEGTKGVIRSITYGESSSSSGGYVPEVFNSESLPSNLASEIQRFLRVANMLEWKAPRVAYLCRFHAFEIAHSLDRNSTGRKVRQFKTLLLQRLERDEETSKTTRQEPSDSRELKRVYDENRRYINQHAETFDLENSHGEKLLDACRIVSVLYEVLKTVIAGHQALADRDSIRARSEMFAYNILPLDHGGIQQAIMKLPEIKLAIGVIRNVRGLPATENVPKRGTFVDSFEFLQYAFGFQKESVANQREHLILLLANALSRQPKKSSTLEIIDASIDELMRKFFKNYTNWCKYLVRKSSIRLPCVKQDAQQYKILYIGLYLLIWGEAANLRFMPECLCYIFHHMAYELHGMLTGAVSMTTGETVMPAYGGSHESFLSNVVTPIYKVIYEEAQKNKSGTADHTTWRNYDDLNEFFWSPDCFQIGWPMRTEHDFFFTKSPQKEKGTKDEELPKKEEGTENEELLNKEKVTEDEEMGLSNQVPSKENREPKWLGKTNFAEIRSFWQVFRSFDRMWSFFILSLQAMIIMACHDVGSPLEVFDKVVLEDVMSIFITSAVLKLIQAILEIIFTWKARNTMELSQKRIQVLRLGSAVIWTVVLPVIYAHSRRKYTCYSTQYESWLGQWCYSSYMVAVVIYLMINAVDLVLFFVPAVSKYIEISNWRICKTLCRWAQPRLYVGRGMQETQVSLFKYTFFWILVLSTKLVFSYSFEIKPLIAPTREIMKIGVQIYDWHELFPKVRNNAGAIVAVWAPIIVVYFMDTQIWYSVYCTICGGLYGILHHLGEIRTLGMLRSRFHSLPSAFNRLIPPQLNKSRTKNFLQNIFCKASKSEVLDQKFVLVWNKIIRNFRSEDLISNREMDLMTIPTSGLFPGFICWPIFLLANKFSTAVSIARDFVGKDEKLFKRIRKDEYMYFSVKECYESVKFILDVLIVGDLEKRIVSNILNEIDRSIEESSFLKEFKMSALPALQAKFVELLELLVEGNENQSSKVVEVLQDMFELLTNDMMANGHRIVDLIESSPEAGDDSSFFSGKIEPQLFESVASQTSIFFPLPDDGPLIEQIKRLHLLLTVKDKAMDIPANLEARRRISFFATSLFMDMPNAPEVGSMLSFSVMTPHFMEDVNFSLKELQSSKGQVSIIFYMQNIFPDEWKNFLERMGYQNFDELMDDGKEEEIRRWASFRGQTLSRTVRGIMYYRQALKLQALLERPEYKDVLEDINIVERNNPKLSAELDALADMKFTYVVSCQMFGSHKSSGDPRAEDIKELMIRYPALRVAYIEEKEEIVGDKPQKMGEEPPKVYSSILAKAVGSFDQVIYRIKLPGPPIIGEGKPENQNHAIIFTRGDALQTIDMNQDSYLEEALKVRNLLQEFLQNHGRRPPTILGLREHIFTGSVSSLAWFMSYQETSFVTIGQRLLANPLRVRFHYGHPDVFDRLFHITRGGISKASKTINLSEDVFAGFNSTLRRGCITYHEYLQVGKGRDVGLNQISRFEAKVANGNSEQTISRDIHRLGRRFDFFRMLSCYFTTIGFYFSSLISVLGIYVFLYGQLYLVLSGLQKALLIEARMHNIESLETALASQSFIQLGLLTGLPMVMEIGLEKGFLTALKDFVLMQLQLAAVFFTFSLGTKTHHFGRTLMYGGAQYIPTGRKVVVFHASFTENYRLYSRSHFVKGFELVLLLVVYDLFRRSYQSSMAYVLITYSVWFMTITWLFAPFLFNPSGFDWDKIVDDWKGWNKWIKEQGGIGIRQDKSWQSWWNDEQAHLRRSGYGARLFEILLSIRFFLYQYGLVYHLDISQQSKNFLVYVLSWVVILAVFLTVKAVNIGKQLFSANYHLMFRFFKAFLFLSVFSIVITLSVICELSTKDILVCCLAFLPTGWGLILVAQAVRPIIENTGFWHFTEVLAQAYDYGMGTILFSPIAVLAWLPIISAFQTRFLFNQAFNRHLQIQPILAAKKQK
ncbi:putative callose synthase 8 isoform X1 [Hibiscus syriacus]|uniref:putative callose synthase 8 isoform X1 n=1 Tax=Hibiscus syriacus TaxID=106335 RepID=UPI0019206E3F|nr:putative callose synthase 8 isoform X1 [Hibiscus syriacus]